MGKIRGEETWISLGPWGGNGGTDWAYKVDGPIMKMTIYGSIFIRSIVFESNSGDGVTIGSSEKIDGTSDYAAETFCIDNSVEQLSSISLTYNDYLGQPIITSLCIETNIGNNYGPFGSKWGSSASIPVNDGFLAGFHGRTEDGLITAIGIFVAPKVNSLCPIQDQDFAPTQLKVRPHQQKNVGIVIHDEQSINVICSNEDECRQELVQAKQMSCKGKEKATYAMGNKNERGKIIGEEGWISLGPWGREGGVYSTYKSDGPIMQITVSCGDVIDYILFESKSRNGVVIGSSVKIGGHGGANGAKFCIDSSVEHLSAISLTYGDYCGYMVIKEICFFTNRKTYGPFGMPSGDSPVYIPIKWGVIVGFYGCGGFFLDAIGIFVAPKVNFSSLKKDPDYASTQLESKIISEEGWISLGPWGREGGVYSTYKSDGPIMQITIRSGDVIDSILFESTSRNGVVIGSSVKIGGHGGANGAKFCIDSSVEHLSAISLTYGDYYGYMVIKEICFFTNLKTYGPFGMPSGDSSIYIPINGEVIVGFYGCGGLFLDSIGIFVAPKVNNFSSSKKDPDYASTQLEDKIIGVQDKIIGEEGWISLGPWGGGHGVYSTYKPDEPMMQITIRYGEVIDSILFESKSRDGVIIGSSVKIGGPGGASVGQFCIDSSVEQFSSVSLTYKDYSGYLFIKSLCFNTNKKKYGPFGSGGDHSLSIPIEGGVIAGFHGRGENYVEAIGIFVAPKVKGKMGEEGWISFGPWGGNDGVDWTYKANGPIMQISICYGEAINSVLFQSRSCDGLVIGSSEEFGATGSRTTKTFFIDSSVEQLSLLRLTYGDYYGQVAITSLYFETNIGKHYGPFGLESGASSVSIPIAGGFIAGFHGRCGTGTGTYLTAIGIFVAPKVNILPSSEKNIDSLPSFQDPVPTQPEVLGSGAGSKPKTVETPTIKSKWSSRFLVANLKAIFCGSKPKTLENIIIDNAASSSTATTNKDGHHGGALSLSSETIRMNLDFMDLAFNNLNLVDSAFQKYKTHMDMEISEAREKLKEQQRLGSWGGDLEKLGKAIAKLKFQIPLATNKDDHHGGALSPTSKMIHSDLNLLDTAFAEAEESAHHKKVKINQAHEKFKELQTLPRSERHSYKLQKTIAKLKVQIRSHNKIRSADSNPPHKNWDNINEDEDGMTHFFHKEPEVAHTGDFDGLLEDFCDLPEPLRCCLSCFFKFPPMATIKRTSMIYLWIGQGYISEYLRSEGCVWDDDVEMLAGKIFDDLIAKGFIEPIYQNCSLVPDKCKMSLSVRSSLYKEAKDRGFISNGTSLDLDPESGDLIRQSSCLINVGEAIVNFQPEILENMTHIQSLYLGRWQSSATHHIELADAKIPHGMNKLNSLTFLSLRGISMITELPTFISELNNLMILDLRACHNLEVIPTDIGSLKSLTHLDMSECYFLEQIPKSLAQLSNLQVLKGFLIGDFDNKQSCTLHDLSGLPKLRKLNIYISVKDLVKLQDLTYLERFESLKKLTISWGGCFLQAREEDIAKAFGVATLPPKLQKIDLQCFPMTSLTNWLMPGKLKELKKLYIRGGQLRDLGEIQKRQAERLTVEILQLKYLSKLELYWRELRTLFPKLIYLHQVECPNLFNFQCDERGMWVDHKAIDTHMQLQKYLKTCGAISSSSMVGSGSTSAQDNCNMFPVDEKQL